MNKHNRLAVAVVFVLVVVSFFIETDSSIIGFTVSEVSAAEVEPGVEEVLNEEGDVEVIVVLKDDEGNFLMKGKEADVEEVKDNLNYLEFKEGHDFDDMDTFSGEITKTALRKLRNNPNVEKIQLDHNFGIALSDSVSLINADDLHQKILLNNLTGKNIGVCVLDTGIDYNHADLSDNYADGYDYVNDDVDPLDDHGHGTHVSGIVAGVAPEVKLIHIKVLGSSGTGSESDIVAGINWCIYNKTVYNISAISMSLGAGLFSSNCDSSFTALANAVDSAVGNGIVVIASSGNDGSTTGISSPGCIQNVISVGGSDKSDNIASYTNRNSLLDLLAPGSSIVSTTLGGGTGSMSGTSMAAPHVSGSVALIQQFETEEDGAMASVSNVKDALKDNGVLISSWNRIDVLGSVISLDSTLPVLVVDSPSNGTYDGNIDLNYSVSDVFLDSVYYTLDSGDENILNGNTTLSLGGGNYILEVVANDSGGNSDSSTFSLTVDLPGITLNSPEDNANDLDGEVQFNCSASSTSGLSNVSLYHNATGVWGSNLTEIINGTSADVLFNLNFTGDLKFVWSCGAYDVNSNSILGENRTLRINVNHAPVINDYFPSSANVTIDEPVNQTFNVSYSDSDGDSLDVSWYKDGSLVGSDDVYDFVGSYLSSGSFNITVDVSDSELIVSNYWNFIVGNTEACGDEGKNSTEECDGSDFGGLDCGDYGYIAGSLSCDSCLINSGGCTNSTGSTGGDTGGSGGGGTRTSEESALLEEAVAAQSGTGGGSGSSDDELAVFSDEQDIATEASGEEGDSTVEETEILEEGGFKVSKAVYGVIGGLVALVLFGLFIKKEWKIIKKKSGKK